MEATALREIPAIEGTPDRRTPISVAWGWLSARAAKLTGIALARRAQQAFTGTHVRLYRLLGGRFVGHLGPAPLLLLTTTGRRSGVPRTTPVIYVPGLEPTLVASNGGAARHPQWYLNLEQTPEAAIEVGRERHLVRAEVVEGEERERRWAEAVALYPDYATYQARSPRRLPVIALRRGG